MLRFSYIWSRTVPVPANLKAGHFHKSGSGQILTRVWPDLYCLQIGWLSVKYSSLEVFEMTLTEVSSYESYSELELSNKVQNYALGPAVKCVPVLLYYLLVIT